MPKRSARIRQCSGSPRNTARVVSSPAPARRAGEPQIDRKQPDPECSPGHAACAEPPGEQAIAQQRTKRDPDGKQCQKQGHDRLFRSEDETDIGGELRQISRAGQPKP